MCIYIYIYLYIYLSLSIILSLSLYLSLYIYLSISLSLYIYIYACIYVCVYIYIYIYIHTHTYLYTSRCCRCESCRGAERPCARFTQYVRVRAARIPRLRNARSPRCANKHHHVRVELPTLHILNIRGNWSTGFLDYIHSPVNSRRFPEISVRTKQKYSWKTVFSHIFP